MDDTENFYEKLDIKGIKARIKEIREKRKREGKETNAADFMRKVNPGYFIPTDDKPEKQADAKNAAATQWSKWESDKTEALPDRDVLLAIARAGGVSLEWLLCGKDDISKTKTTHTSYKFRNMAEAIWTMWLCGAKIEYPSFDLANPEYYAKISIPTIYLQDTIQCLYDLQTVGKAMRKYGFQAVRDVILSIPSDDELQK